MCWNEWRRRSISGIAVLSRLPVRASLVLLVGCVALCAVPDKLKDLQTHFDHETHAAGKIKTFEKLGEAQFDAATKAGQSSDFASVAFTFEKYRDNARTAFQLLKKQEPDADHHSEGYRHLELQVRRGIREVEETLLTVPEPLRPPLLLVRQDLITLDDDLIRELFPRRSRDPEKTPPAPSPAPPESNP